MRTHPSALTSSIIAPNEPTVQTSHFLLDPLRSLLFSNPVGCSYSRKSLSSQWHSVPLLWALLLVSHISPSLIQPTWSHPTTTRASSAGLTGTGCAQGSYFRVFALEATLKIPFPRYPYDSSHSIASIVWFKYLLHQLKLLDYHVSYYFTASYF